MNPSDLADIRALRDMAEEALMRGAALHNDSESRRQYLDFSTAIADTVLSCDHADAAKAIYIGLYAVYARVPEDEVKERFGQSVLDHLAQATRFENEIKLGRSGESVKPFLPGVQAHLAAEMIEGAKQYSAFKDGDPEILRHYVSALLTGAQTLDDENLEPSLRHDLRNAKQLLAALAGQYGGPGLIEGASLSPLGEVRKPGGPG